MKRYILSVTFCILSSIQLNALDIVFRCDDILLSDETQYPRIDSLLTLFSKHGIPLSFAVIPYDKQDSTTEVDTRLVQLLETANHNHLIEICQHGYNHTELKPNFGEFYGLSYEVQLAKIQTGKKYLESLLNCQIQTFIPPHDRFDSTTLQVVHQLRFTVFSSNMEFHQPYIHIANLNYYPYTLQNISDYHLIEHTHFNHYAYCVCLFHIYDLNTPVKWEELDKVLYSLRKSEYHFYTFTQLSHKQTSPYARIQATQKPNYLKRHLLKWHILNRYLVYPYWLSFLDWIK